jgi:hypothetical protein
MIQTVIMYNAKCDTCGHEPEFGDFSCYADRDSVSANHISEFTTIKEALGAAFIWSASPEGGEYWKTISDNLL